MLTVEIIGKRIRDLREKNKISQQSMVEDLKNMGVVMSRETLSKIENGNRTISAIELKAVCSVLNVEPETLLAESEEENLVTLFRKKNVGEETLKSIEYVQDMIVGFINQKKILSNEFENPKREPLWKE
ncbi:helix-turn-helix domain-containing protein [Clostridium coskatii]|uniref:Helix-turn-helix domain protein n=1 Tax=Clostridium coskatii TaxID=1705578 RepID=A0A166TDE8_9CLOT|nr:helix-turn-helix transcriptional regulator [Clostridium coskatii]OAA93547.1 Helix-turn-helix domain protein [Clostridium coskatii]OBR96336.1 helix-turn-helix domain protein [Clostridium coskatii]